MSSNNHSHSIMPDVTGLVLVANSWLPQWANNITVSTVFKGGMFLLSMALTILAIIDYSMKISWKVKQHKRSKERCPHIDKCANVKPKKYEDEEHG